MNNIDFNNNATSWLDAASQQQDGAKLQQVIGHYYADIVVDNEVVIELKGVNSICPEHSAQIVNYLKEGKYKTGLLLNFGSKKLEII